MRQTKFRIATQRETPSDAVALSHILMLRTGMIRSLAAGVFNFLPLGNRALQKAQNIIREEMNNISGQEFLMPALNPIEIWEQTNRVEAMGDVLFHIKGTDLVLAPTHEEIITFNAKAQISTYRDMPQIWYQIQTKFRNEARPKSGVIRGRQFIMKDAYSLDSTWEGLDVAYDMHYEAYHKIFNRLGIKFFVVGASSGAMGGKKSQEFMVESGSGEDICAITDTYAANFEIATSSLKPVSRLAENPTIEEFATPNAKSINDLIEQFGIAEERCAKSVIYIVNDEPLLILMRGNDELNETKLQAVCETNKLRPATNDELVEYSGASHGSIGPVGTKLKVIADLLLQDANGMVSGANKDGYHLKNIDLKRDTSIAGFYDLRMVQEGEPSITDGQPLRVVKAIELGHIFKLGTRYTEALGAYFTDADGKDKPIIMGSYGIGVERCIACYIEQNCDEKGIIWNKALAPFDIHILGLNYHKSSEIKDACDTLSAQLEAVGYDVLVDDREETAGVKFNDADLIGCPIQIIVGGKNLKDRNIEIKFRRTDERVIVAMGDTTEYIKNRYNE